METNTITLPASTLRRGDYNSDRTKQWVSDSKGGHWVTPEAFQKMKETIALRRVFDNGKYIGLRDNEGNIIPKRVKAVAATA